MLANSFSPLLHITTAASNHPHCYREAKYPQQFSISVSHVNVTWQSSWKNAAKYVEVRQNQRLSARNSRRWANYCRWYQWSQWPRVRCLVHIRTVVAQTATISPGGAPSPGGGESGNGFILQKLPRPAHLWELSLWSWGAGSRKQKRDPWPTQTPHTHRTLHNECNENANDKHHTEAECFRQMSCIFTGGQLT